MTVESTPKPIRVKNGPFTPRIPRSATSTPDSTEHPTLDQKQHPRPSSALRGSLVTPNPTKVRSALSIEAKPRKKPSGLLGTSRSRTNSPLPPASPPKMASRPLFQASTSIKDPEDGIVDWQKLEDGDISVELDDDDLFSQTEAEDKVLVSVRIKPTSENEIPAWETNIRQGTVKLQQAHARAGVPNAEFRFDNVLTGSENKQVYATSAKAHVRAAMEGYNAVVFAYGQTASGKTFTLSGDDSEPGIIPRAMRDVFSYIRKTPSREFLLRASYLEIYNEQIHDLLSPASSGGSLVLQDNGVVVNLREEVVMTVKGLKEVLERGEANRRTASTDWNSRSSRSHSVFRLTIESREVSLTSGESSPTHGTVPSTPGGSRLQAKGGQSVRMSTLSLIDLAGSEKATSDKDRTREGKYINTSLLTLGTVIGTLAENAAKKKQDFVPYRNSKLTKLLQPSLSGNARISVICTLNPTVFSISESTSTLGFASRVKKVALHAVRKETVDTDALLERYRKEIEELKSRLEEREREVQAPTVKRRLSAREKQDENKAMSDLSKRINQLTKVILTSQTVAEAKGDESRPVSPCKLDFDLTPFELQEQLLAAKRTIETQATQILSLEASLQARPLLPSDAPETEKDRLIQELQKTVKEFEIVTAGYEENLGAPLRAVKEDVEKEWKPKVAELENKLEVKNAYIEELEKGLERTKQLHLKSEQEKIALIGFVREIDSQFAMPKSRIPAPSSAYNNSSLTSFRPTLSPLAETANKNMGASLTEESPIKMVLQQTQSLFEEAEVELALGDGCGDISFGDMSSSDPPGMAEFAVKSMNSGPIIDHDATITQRSILGNKENIPI